jgi:hypothetical protein
LRLTSVYPSQWRCSWLQTKFDDGEQVWLRCSALGDSTRWYSQYRWLAQRATIGAYAIMQPAMHDAAVRIHHATIDACDATVRMCYATRERISEGS